MYRGKGTLSNLLIANSQISGNHAIEGGALYTISDVTIVSSTIAKNSAAAAGGAIWLKTAFHPAEQATVDIFNTILWGNQAPTDIVTSGPIDSFTVEYSTIQDGNPDDADIPFGGVANHNIDDNPSFVDFANNDFHLAASSPAIDVANSIALISDEFDLDDDGDTVEPAPDLDFLDRIFGAHTDMGAFEFAN